MSLTSFLSGIESFAVKSEAEIQAIEVGITTLQAALAAAPNTSPVMANLEASLVLASAFLKTLTTDTAPLVTALQATVAALEPKS